MKILLEDSSSFVVKFAKGPQRNSPSNAWLFCPIKLPQFYVNSLIRSFQLIGSLGEFSHGKEKSIMMNWQHRSLSLVVKLILLRYIRKDFRGGWKESNCFRNAKSISIKIRFWSHSTGRPKRQPFISQTSSVTEAPSDEVEAEQEGDEDVEPARVTQ